MSIREFVQSSYCLLVTSILYSALHVTMHHLIKFLLTPRISPLNKKDLLFKCQVAPVHASIQRMVVKIVCQPNLDSPPTPYDEASLCPREFEYSVWSRLQWGVSFMDAQSANAQLMTLTTTITSLPPLRHFVPEETGYNELLKQHTTNIREAQ